MAPYCVCMCVCVALNGRLISISIRGSDCSHNLSMSIWGERFLSVCQLPNVHSIWQTAHSSIFTKHVGNQTTQVSPAMAFVFVLAPVKRFQMCAKRQLSWGGWSVCARECVCVYLVCRTVNMIHRRGLIKSLLQPRKGVVGFFILAEEDLQSQQKSLFCLRWQVKVHEDFVHFYGWMQARSLHGWLVQYTCNEWFIDAQSFS